jgi:hypothetical protein
VSDIHDLPDDHPLKPLEGRLLEMAGDLGPLRHIGGNAVAALRAFAREHPGLHDDTRTCACCGVLYDPRRIWWSQEWLNEWVYCPDCGKRESTSAPCPKCGGRP